VVAATLFELQKTVEAILGPHLHKQNFRRLVESGGLVEPTGDYRFLAGSFEPQIFFFAERAFAGGLPYLKGGWHQSTQAQQLTVERMRQQRVPLVLINVVTEPEVRGFSIVYQYIQDNYREAWRGNFGNGPDYKVFVKRDLPTRGTYPPFDLPCYR